jgi:hypothetical protein
MRLTISAFLIALLPALAVGAAAQEPSTHSHDHPQAPPAAPQEPQAPPQSHEGHGTAADEPSSETGENAPGQEEPGGPGEEKTEDQGEDQGMAGHAMQDHEMHDMQGMAAHDMHGMHEMKALYGPYGMTREASGTAWQPDSAPHHGFHFTAGPWELMAHGMATLAYDDQEGRRGDRDVFSSNMAMLMGSRPAGPGRLGVRAMVSLEPWTIGKQGYPLLLQTGETADGETPLVDRQHPHDLFMELAATYSLPLSGDSSVFAYLGLPGEPALGPPAFMHRFAAMENPEAPLSHHWLDSTHITYGVATAGWVKGPWKLEGSLFTGREPDENRTGIESPKMDSWSARLSWNPTPDWSLQASRGRLNSPEQLEPEIDTTRSTFSAIYNRLRPGGNWQTVFAWGRNAKDPGEATDSMLLESALTVAPRHTFFARAERQENDELAGAVEGGPHGEVVDVGKLTAGYVYDLPGLPELPGLPASGELRLGLGGLASVAFVPRELEAAYGGSRPISFMLFLRARN